MGFAWMAWIVDPGNDPLAMWALGERLDEEYSATDHELGDTSAKVRAVVRHAAGDVRVEQRGDPRVVEPAHAINPPGRDVRQEHIFADALMPWLPRSSPPLQSGREYLWHPRG